MKAETAIAVIGGFAAIVILAVGWFAAEAIFIVASACEASQ